MCWPHDYPQQLQLASHMCVLGEGDVSMSITGKWKNPRTAVGKDSSSAQIISPRQRPSEHEHQAADSGAGMLESPKNLRKDTMHLLQRQTQASRFTDGCERVFKNPERCNTLITQCMFLGCDMGTEVESIN